MPVAFDALSVATLTPGNPVLQGGLGVLGSSAATAQLTIPPNAALSGLRFYATGFTYDPTSLPLGTVFPKALQIDLP